MKKKILCILSILTLLVPVLAQADYYNIVHCKGFHMALPGTFERQDDRDGWFVFQDPATQDTIEIKYDTDHTLTAALAYSLFGNDMDTLLAYIRTTIWDPAEERMGQSGSAYISRDDLVAFTTWGFPNPMPFMFVSKGGVLWIRVQSPKTDDLYGLLYAVTYNPGVNPFDLSASSP